jgi:hypothetical protein
VSGTSAGSTAPFAPAHEEQWKRKLLAVLLAFIMGFLLAWFLHKCPQPGGGGGGGGGAAGGGGGGGGGHGSTGSPTKLGQGSGKPGDFDGGAAAGGNFKGGGGGGGDGHGDADLPSGPPAPDGGTPGTAPDQPPANGSAKDFAGNLVMKSAEGKMSTGKSTLDTMPAGPPPANLLSAHDFTYDSTGLPRYASGVTQVASGLSTDTVRHKKSTMAAIVTTDSFDQTVNWYKGQVPAGWHNSVIGDMDAMSKALTPDAITNMISGATSGGPVDTTALTAAANGRKNGVAVFNPPNQTTDSRSIMIISRPGQPTQILMTKKLQP